MPCQQTTQTTWTVAGQKRRHKAGKLQDNAALSDVH